MIKNRNMPDISRNYQFIVLAGILEQLVKMSKKLRGFSDQCELFHRVAELSMSERQNIKSQILSVTIPASGGVIVLDPASSIINTSSASSTPSFKLPRVVSSTGKVETDNLRWLKDQKGPIVIRDIKHRHAFNRDIHHGGLLTSSRYASVHLMEAWPCLLQSKAADVRPGIVKENTLPDCKLICVKMAKCDEGLRRLHREGSALLALQDTGRVAELWNPSAFAQYLHRGMLITLYQPVPPPQDSGHDVYLSLDEAEDRIEELSRALSILHVSGWIWLGLQPKHILFRDSKMDPRDIVPPLRILGLENARCMSGTHCFEFVADSIWAAPEVSNHQPNSTNHLKVMGQVSDAQNNMPERGPTAAADMYSLGLLVSAYLARSLRPAKASSEEMCYLFNACVYNPIQKIRVDHWLVGLASDLLQDDPLLRPTAEQVLTRISLCRRDRTLLHRLEPSMCAVDGYIHPLTLQMVWPVVLKTCIIPDQRNQQRMTDYVTVHAGIETPSGKVVADYRGRPVSKQYLQWLRHLRLHSHALSDGDRGAIDGRRKCNGIFDMAYYKHFRQVLQSCFVSYTNKV